MILPLKSQVRAAVQSYGLVLHLHFVVWGHSLFQPLDGSMLAGF